MTNGRAMHVGLPRRLWIGNDGDRLGSGFRPEERCKQDGQPHKGSLDCRLLR